MVNESAEDDVLLQLRVLIIEDQADIAQALKTLIERDGMQAAVAGTGAAAIELKGSFDPQVVLVDLGLPDTSGLGLIRWLVAKADCGIIVVSGHTDEADRVAALELGADDYVTKPPSGRELIARIHAVHRRTAIRRVPVVAAKATVRPVMTIGNARVDLTHRVAMSATGEEIHLTGAEFTVLEQLVDAGGAAVARERLFEVALHRTMNFEDRAIDQIIFALRHKLAGGDDGRKLIQSIRGQGYCLLLGPQ
jgi:DNA-binding response OmpR family regulator